MRVVTRWIKCSCSDKDCARVLGGGAVLVTYVFERLGGSSSSVVLFVLMSKLSTQDRRTCACSCSSTLLGKGSFERSVVVGSKSPEGGKKAGSKID